METLSSSTATILSHSLSSHFKPSSTKRFIRFPIFSKSSGNGKESDMRSGSEETGLVPIRTDQTLSKDAAMGIVLSAASVRGWTTDSGMEGPPVPAGAEPGSIMDSVSTFPWSLFTKSPRRRMLVAFTCNVCGQRTTRAINPHAYTDGTVFVQCCGCNVFHKLVDNLNLFHEMKCYVNPSFQNPDQKGDITFKYLDIDDENNDIFPMF